MNFLKRFWWLFLLGAAIGGGIVLLRMNSENKKRAANSYTVKKADLKETLSLSGSVDAEEKADLKFQTSGLLTWVGVKEGDVVKKYQAIAALDKRELQNNLSTYLNSYMKQRWDFEQDQQNNKDWQTLGMTDLARDTIKRTLDKDQFDLNNSVLAVEAKNLALKFATLTTPIEGIVTHVDVPVPGTNITPSAATFSVVNPTTLYFSASADQTDVPNFSEGMQGTIILDSFPDNEIPATVYKIGFVPKEGEAGTVYELKIAFSDPTINSKLKMGMTGDANFVIKEQNNVLAAPEKYVKKDGDVYYVEVIKNGLTQKQNVQIGGTIDGQTVITSGINENDVIYYQP